ncbi:MAG: hypothetical protein U0Z53_08110 [Blastocatellia bacterium]
MNNVVAEIAENRALLAQLLNELSLARFEKLTVWPAAQPVEPEAEQQAEPEPQPEELTDSALESLLLIAADEAAERRATAPERPPRRNWNALLETLAGRTTDGEADWLSENVADESAGYFAAEDFVIQDPPAGLLSDRSGTRLMAVPESLTLGLLEGLADECGRQWQEVISQCGIAQGRHQMTQLEQHFGELFGAALGELPAAQVQAALMEAWAAMGWGQLRFDLSHLSHGLLRVTVQDGVLPAAYESVAHASPDEISDHLTAGLLTGMFSHATHSELEAVQLSGEPGAAGSVFILALKERLADVPGWVRAGQRPEEIIRRLIQSE